MNKVKASLNRIENGVWKMSVLCFLLLVTLVGYGCGSSGGVHRARSIGEGEQPARGIHDFVVKNMDDKDVRLGEYAGNVLLLVNVASKCGFSVPNAGWLPFRRWLHVVVLYAFT